jgi:hypothetical protein
MWGGFVFCAMWHLLSLLLLWTDGERKENIFIMSALTMNLGLSGVSLCYFGMLAFK